MLNDIVIGKIIYLEKQKVQINIFVVNNKIISHQIEGFIPRYFMAFKNIDSIKVQDMVDVGDIVMAKVKNLNETKKILLSIADDRLGVLVSEDNGEILKPINNSEMKNFKTEKVFKKKVALAALDSDSPK